MQLDEDLQNLQLDRPGRGKSVEQIKKHTVDSQFENKPIERSVFLLTKGDDIQKLSVIQALPQLLQAEPTATYSRIIPKILQELPNSSCEFHVMTSKVFRVLMERQVPVNLLHAVIQGIESRDPIISNAWMETLLGILGVLTDTQIKTEIMPLTNFKAQLAQPISSRVASCKILGKLATHKGFEPVDVKREILPLAQSLCQDCHSDVRTAMCIQLPQVAQGLGNMLVRSSLLTSLVELASDEHMYVRSAAITATVQIFPFVTLETKKTTLLQLVKQLCEKCLRTVDITSTTIAKEIGKLVEGLQLALTANESIWFLHCYKSLARRGLASNTGEIRSIDASLDVLCRQHCASNLPAMANFTFTAVSGQIDVFYGVFRELAADPCYMVRRTVAGCIHEIVKTFGAQSKMVKPDIVRLLRDDSEDVLQMLVPHLGNTLEVFCTHGTLSRQSSTVSTVEIGRALIKCHFELSSGYNWRLLTQFIHQLEHLPNCFPPEFIHQNFTPIVLNNAVQGRAKPVRSEAARTLLIFLRYNGKEMQRRWLRDNLITQLCYSKCCYTRHIFVRLCVNAIEIFSEKYFKEHFYQHLLDLSYDPVANIRLCVASLFCSLKRMLVIPEDLALSEKLRDVFQKYVKEETDRDVIGMFQRNMEEIKQSAITFNKEEHDKEEKKRQEEEEKIAACGRSNAQLVPRKNNKPSSRPGSISKHSSSREFKPTTGSQRSLSVPPKIPNPSPSTSNDMSFLEQHFYIDAGVNLPTSSEPNSRNVVGKLTNSFITIPQATNDALPSELSSNITDDDKVNLRKLCNNNNKVEKINKRYSSVMSTTCLEKNQERKALNRRSLNITSKESSKIPVISYKNFVKMPEKKIVTNNDENKPSNVDFNNSYAVSSSKSNSLVLESNNNSNQGSLKMTSQLPVLKRRSVSEIRKPF